MTTADGRSSAHPRTRLPRLVGSVLAGVLALAACSTSTPVDVVVDPSLEAGESFEVDGLENRYPGRPLVFGPFRTEKTHVGWTSTRSTDAGTPWWQQVPEFQRTAGVTTTPYTFDFAAGSDERWHVACRSTAAFRGWRTESPVASGLVGVEARLDCAIRDPQETVHSLAVHGGPRDYVGEASFAADTVVIRTLHELPAADGRVVSVPGVLGFELRHGDRAVAGVDLLRARVYLARGLAPALRTPVALTAAVLMLCNERCPLPPPP
jgi:hypothetical protein